MQLQLHVSSFSNLKCHDFEKNGKAPLLKQRFSLHCWFHQTLLVGQWVVAGKGWGHTGLHFLCAPISYSSLGPELAASICSTQFSENTHVLTAKIGTWTCLTKGSEIAIWEGSVTESAQSWDRPSPRTSLVRRADLRQSLWEGSSQSPVSGVRSPGPGPRKCCQCSYMEVLQPSFWLRRCAWWSLSGCRHASLIGGGSPCW